MILTMAWKAFRDIRAGALLAGGVGAILAASASFMFEGYASAIEGLEDISIYQGFTGSSVVITEPEGFLAAIYFAWIPLLLIVVGILGGTGALSAQEEDGSLDLILAQPVPRWKVLLGTALGLGSALTIATALAIPAFAISIPLADLDLPIGRAFSAVLVTIPLILLFVALGLLLAAAMPSRGTAVAATMALAIAGYFLQVMGSISSDLEPFRLVSPFSWAEAGQIMADGIHWGRLAAMSLGVVVLTGIAIWLFERREIVGHHTIVLPLHTSPPPDRTSDSARAEHDARVIQEFHQFRFPVARQAARNMRGGAFGIGLTAFLMALMLGYYYPEVVAELDSLGDLDWITDLAGPAGAYTTPAGFFTLEFFSWVPLLYIAIGIAAATGAVGTEESRGTMDLVLAQPISRRRFIVEKILGITAALTLSIALCIPGFALAIPIGDLDISLFTVSRAILMMGVLVLMHTALSLWLAAWLPTRSGAAILASFIVTAGYVLQVVGSLVPALDTARKLSPFYWADSAEAMVNGIDLVSLAALLSLTFIFVWAALSAFDRREISAGGGEANPVWKAISAAVHARTTHDSHPTPTRGTSDV